MIAYFDSSALLKRYISEVGSDAVDQALEEAQLVATVSISLAELVAALAKLIRSQTLSPTEAETARNEIKEDWPSILQVQADNAVVRRAAEVAWSFGLRGYDSIQLAAALQLSEILNERVAFWTFDRRLWAAAQAARLLAQPPGLVSDPAAPSRP